LLILIKPDSLTFLTLLEISLQEVSLSDITSQIQKLGYRVTDPHMDGYYQWGQKQKLYYILWETQRQLKKCSEFYGEEEWLQEHEEEVIIDKLKGNQL